MSLDKAIQHGKEKRKPYTGGKAIARSCRNHGGCDWCKENRMYHDLRESDRQRQRLEEYKEVEDERNINQT